MATLDDKLLGEKLHYYCSSSEDEGDSDNEDRQHQPASAPPQALVQTPKASDYDGCSSNTGPKGVLKDWRRFKQLETEKREEAELEKMALAQKLSLTCRSTNDDDKAAKKDADIDTELEELLDDGFLEAYMQKRMQEMMESTQNVKRFGMVVDLFSGESFLDNVDQEDERVTVVIMIYEPNSEGCTSMNGSIECLASEYVNVKFCKILSTAAGLSKHFKSSGVPALLIYRAGQLMGSFVRMTDQLGDDFFANDVESFLIEHGMLPNKEDVPKIIRGPAIGNDDDSDVSLE